MANSYAIDPSTVNTLLITSEPVPQHARVVDVFERLAREPGAIALAVVDGDRPVGLVNRKALIERFARPFARELLGRKPIEEFMETSPLVVDRGMDLEDLGRVVLDGDTRYLYEGFILVDQGRYVGMGTGHDLMRVLTERKQSRLYRLAHYDALTELPNRLLFRDRLGQALAQSRRQGALVALMFVDLDRFKRINDTFGHVAGDLLLKMVAARLAGCVRESDTVARMGGDEFTVTLCCIDDLRAVADVAQKILNALQVPYNLQGHEVVVTGSVGIAMYPFDWRDNGIDGLLRQADQALYRAKAQGRNNYQFYRADMNEANVERLTLETKLRRAVEREEFVVHYQPRFATADHTLLAAEALVRWQPLGAELVSPASFIPLAEETGLILPLGEQVLRAACTQTARWGARTPAAFRTAVNLSARQFNHANIAQTIGRILTDTALNPAHLEVEITESVAMDNAGATIDKLKAIADMGISIAIDDFGTGYSSLSYLKRFPVDSVKIDKSFIRDVPHDPDDVAIVLAIIDMAHRLGLRVVAEGVETGAQLAFLKQHGCEEVQGYLTGRPCAAPAFADAFLQAAAVMNGGS